MVLLESSYSASRTAPASVHQLVKETTNEESKIDFTKSNWELILAGTFFHELSTKIEALWYKNIANTKSF